MTQAEKFWYDELTTEQSWTSLWNGYIICSSCSGIRKVEGKCPACKTEILNQPPLKLKNRDGEEFEVPMNAFMGAEGRYEDYVYLNMLEYEWKRPTSQFDHFSFLSQDKRPSAKAIIVLVFWTYFETRIDRLLISAMKGLPDLVRQNLLKRYQSISARTDELYKIIFGKSTSYYLDLDRLGFKNISELLQRIQSKRNEFMHGSPEAIVDKLIEDIIRALKNEHESWIQVYNIRVAGISQ